MRGNCYDVKFVSYFRCKMKIPQLQGRILKGSFKGREEKNGYSGERDIYFYIFHSDVDCMKSDSF